MSEPVRSAQSTGPALPAAPEPVSVPRDPKGGAIVKPSPAPPRVDRLPQFRVLLHNDAVNEMMYVVETLVDLTPLLQQGAARAAGTFSVSAC